MTTVDLGDGEVPVRVEVEFLAPADVTLKKNHPKLVEGFRVFAVSGVRRRVRTPGEH